MSIKVFFQLIRWKNLLLGVCTLALIKFFLIPILIEESSFSSLNFILYTLSIVFISAGGYIFNDLIDYKADLVNKPYKTYIQKSISKQTAKKIAFVFFTTGILLGIISSFKNSSFSLSIYFLGLTTVLILYSKILKSIAILGNITVAALISSSIFMLSFFEKSTYNSTIFLIITCYTLFAFILNFIRELIKDIEDINGDFALNYKTLPILIGLKRSQNITLGFSIILYLALILFIVKVKNLNVLLFYYFIIVVLTPLLYFIYKLYRAKQKKDFTELSHILKFIMLLGILSIFTF